MHDLALMSRHLEKQDQTYNGTLSPLSFGMSPPQSWTQSTVSKFGVRYNPPLPDLSLNYSIEALVEGSVMSSVHEGVSFGKFLALIPPNTLLRLSDPQSTPELAWMYREGRQRRYQGKRVGGTIIVHFLKKNMWFLETASALLYGEDITEYERSRQDKEAGMRTPVVGVTEEREETETVASESVHSEDIESAGDATALVEGTSTTEASPATTAQRLRRTTASRAGSERQ